MARPKTTTTTKKESKTASKVDPFKKLIDKTSVTKKDDSYITFLKILTQFVKNKSNRNYPKMLELIDSHGLSTHMLYKHIMSYMSGHIQFIWYCNKYLCDLFQFYTMEQLLYTLMSLVDLYNINNNINYLKSNDLKDINRDKVITVFSEYHEIIHYKTLNIAELNFLYKLVLKNVITEDDIIDIRKKYTEEPITLNLSQILNNTNDSNNIELLNTYIEKCKTEVLSDKLLEYTKELRTIKSNRDSCKNCPLFNNTMVPFDTNCSDFDNLDVLFIGTSPTVEDGLYNKLNIGCSNILIREKMFNLPENIKWGMINIVPCVTKSNDDLGKKPDKIYNNCKEIVFQIINKFKAYYYVPLGKFATEYFDIKDGIMKASGNIYNMNGAIFLPIIHPSAITHGDYNIKGWENGWSSLQKVLNKHLGIDTKIADNKNKPIANRPNNIQNNNKNYLSNIDPQFIISEPTDDLTLLDVSELDSNNILSIYLDDNGNKYYEIKPFVQTIYVKNDNWNNCKFLTEEYSESYDITGQQKYKLSKLLREILDLNKQNLTV